MPFKDKDKKKACQRRWDKCRRAAKGLTIREVEIMNSAIASRDFSDKGLAKLLGVSQITVSHHKWNIYRKLGAHSAVEAVLIWIADKHGAESVYSEPRLRGRA